MTRKYKYMKKDFRELPARLKHLDIFLSFFDDRVEATNTLEIEATRDMDTLSLDAKELRIIGMKAGKGLAVGEGQDLEYDYDEKAEKLHVKLGGKVRKGGVFSLTTSTHCFPSETELEGIYRDTTPKGAPPQYMSQCEMWGFSRIMPVIDDPRAKCTMSTTMEADSRYTHIISNGNIDKGTNPKGKPVPKKGDPYRKVITYVNDIPMAPYLFIATAGTWDELTDSVTYDSGRKVQLEYLVPPGRVDEVRVLMEVLKKSILWIKEKQDYEYKQDVYRTITMNKSDAGGMENVGNTTIVTDAALIDEHTLDGLFVYAYKVIVHEFEHNQCGSETTMETPFDMWLNEAFTVDVERQFSAEHFNPAMTRMGQVDSLRGPLLGTLVMEDAGYAGRIVREGFNHPRELIDGVTYEKAAEVIRMLRLIIGKECFWKGKSVYFQRYKNTNANSDQFFECFEQAWGKSLESFKQGWLFRIGYPRVNARTSYDESKKEFRIIFTQECKGKPFHIPIQLALVDSSGKDIPKTDMTIHFDGRKKEVVIKGVKEKPAFASLNRDYSFYGVFEQEMDLEELKLQVREDPNLFNRCEAMRRLTDMQRVRLLKDINSEIDEWWLELYGEILKDSSLPSSLKADLIFISEEPVNRDFLTWYSEKVEAREKLMKAVNRRYRKELESLFHATDTYRKGPLEKGIEDRMLKAVLLGLISVEDSPEAHRIIIEHFRKATTPTDRVSALAGLNRTSSPERRKILEEIYVNWHSHLSGYANYLRLIGGGRDDDVWDMIEKEKKRKTMDLKQPTYSRSLIMPMAFNTRMVWTDRGMQWVTDNIIEFSKINTTLSSRLLNVFQLVMKMKPERKAKVIKHLKTIVSKCKDNEVLVGQAKGYLGMH